MKRCSVSLAIGLAAVRSRFIYLFPFFEMALDAPNLETGSMAADEVLPSA
jgi:hypothetical protein